LVAKPIPQVEKMVVPKEKNKKKQDSGKKDCAQHKNF
jgi:hypothetical protein